MAANPAVPDFWRYYDNKKLSDVDIILAEEHPAETARSKRKRQEGEHIFGHSVVLCAFSGYCRTKLEDWDDATDATDQQAGSSSSRARHEIQLLVPAGQLEAGRLLIKGLYQQQPDLSDVSQAQLIQLLLLADRFEVPKVQAAVSAAFKALPPEQLQWDTVMAVHALPAGCAELAACQDLFRAAATLLQHELGDLELALTEPKSSKAKQLLELPFGALKQLLQDERTRVASENTVFYAIQQWHTCQQRQRTQQLESLRQQTQELLQLVRMLQCSQLFIASVVGQWDLATSYFSQHELLLASAISTSAATDQLQRLDASKQPVFQHHPAWLLPARPPSAMTPLAIDWKLPLAELRGAFHHHLETGEKSSLFGETQVWQGLPVRPWLCLHATSDSSDGSTMRLLGFGCSVRVSEYRSAAIAVRVKCFEPDEPDVARSSRHPDLYGGNVGFLGWDDVVQLGAVDRWAEAEAVLRDRGLVGSDSCLHLRLTVSDVQ